MSRFCTSAGLAAVLLGWLAVWNQVRLAVVEPGASTEATAELRIPSVEALDWLATDLADLAPAAEAVPPQRTGQGDAWVLREYLADPSASWGIAYVLRGSRLGGGVLAPFVRTALDLPDGCGTRFLASQGTDPRREWVSFRRRLDAANLPPAGFTAAVDSARWTFRWVGAAMAASSLPMALAGQVSE